MLWHFFGSSPLAVAFSSLFSHIAFAEQQSKFFFVCLWGWRPLAIIEFCTIQCLSESLFGYLLRMAETWGLAWVPSRMVPQSGLKLITVPQGPTPDLCGLASRSHYRSTAKVLLSCHIPLPASLFPQPSTVLGCRPLHLLSVFGLRLRRTDVAPVPLICAAIRWRGHPMVPSFCSAGQKICSTRPLDNTQTHTCNATDTAWHYATLQQDACFKGSGNIFPMLTNAERSRVGIYLSCAPEKRTHANARALRDCFQEKSFSQMKHL